MVAVAFSVITLLTACSKASTVDPAVALVPCPTDQILGPGTIVVSVTGASTESRPALPLEAKAVLTTASTRDDSCVLLVGPDGSQRAWSLTPRRPDGQVERGSRVDRLRQLNIAAVDTAIAQLKAVKPGLDTREAIASGVRAHPSPTDIIVISSGVSTVKPVDLRELSWHAGSAVGAFLRQKGWLPTLTGWRVIFANLGETAGRQPSLDEPTRTTLTAFWLDLCDGAGAASCRAAGAAMQQREPLSRNDVPIVVPPRGEDFPTTTTLPADALFARDSAQLLDPARRELIAVAKDLIEQDLIASITGFADASTGSPAHNRDLSRRRAEAVRNLLVQMGVRPDQIVFTQGLGSAGFSATQESHNPGLAARHRIVVIHLTRRPTE